MPSINLDFSGPVPPTESASLAAPPPATEANSEPSFGNHLRRSGDTPKSAAVPDAETTNPSEDDSRVDGAGPVIGEADRTDEKEGDEDRERSDQDQQEPPRVESGANEVRQEEKAKTDVDETAIVAEPHVEHVPPDHAAETETEAPTTARPVTTEVDRVATGVAPKPVETATSVQGDERSRKTVSANESDLSEKEPPSIESPTLMEDESNQQPEPDTPTAAPRRTADRSTPAGPNDVATQVENRQVAVHPSETEGEASGVAAPRRDHAPDPSVDRKDTVLIQPEGMSDQSDETTKTPPEVRSARPTPLEAELPNSPSDESESEPKQSSRRESEAKHRPHDAPPTRGEVDRRPVSEHAAPKVNQSVKRPVGDVHQTRRSASSSHRAAGGRQAEPAVPLPQAGGDVETFSLDRSPTSETGGGDGVKQTPAGSPAGSPDNPATTPSRLAAHVTRHGTARANGSNITEADRAKFIQRVSRAFHAAEKRGGPMRLRLSPPELGSLRLEVKIEAGVMTARVEAETPAARAILLDNLATLRERLAQQDIRIEQFDVDLMDRQPSGLPDRTAGNTDPNDRQPDRAARFGADADESDQSQERPVPRRPGTEGQLDVVV